MGGAILNIDRYRKLLNANVTPAYPVNLKSVEPIQKHVNKCELRIIPELNAIILLKLSHKWHTTIYQLEPEGILQEEDDSKWLRN